MVITQEDINLYLLNGGDLTILTKEQIAAIPQKVINEMAANGFDLLKLTKEQIAAIPQDFRANDQNLYTSLSNFSEKVSNEYLTKCCFRLSKSAKKILLRVISENSQEGTNALILYIAGKIKKEELPKIVFLNARLRKALLKIIRHKLIQKYNEICRSHGFQKYVPNKVKESFDQKLKGIYKQITENMENYLIELNNEIKEKEEKAVYDMNIKINNLDW